MNHHIGCLVLSSLCVGAFVAVGIWWCSFCRLKPAKRTPPNTNHKKWNKIASDIKLVFHSSTIAMMHGPINIRWSQMYIDLHVKYPLFLLDFQETWIFSSDFRKILDQISWKFAQWSRVVPCGRIDGEMDKHTWRRQYSLFSILQSRLKTSGNVQIARTLRVLKWEKYLTVIYVSQFVKYT